MLDMKDLRRVFKYGENTTAVTLPKELELNFGDYLSFKKIDDNNFKITRVEVKIQNITNGNKQQHDWN